MENSVSIHQFKDFKTAELFAIFRHIYLTSDFMSDDFDTRFRSVNQFGDYYRNMLRQPGSFLLVATMSGNPVGYITIKANEATRLKHTAWLNMGIVENFQRKGIGRQLVLSALQRAKAEGVVEIIYLMVRADHFGAVKLYENTGFEKLSRLDKDTKIGYEYFDGVLMRRFV